MKIYTLSASEESKALVPADECSRELSEKIYAGDRLPRAQDWKPIRYVDSTSSRNRGKRIQDIMWGHLSIVLSQKAKDVFESKLKGACDFLPIIYNKSIYYIMNLHLVIDALDFDETIKTQYPNTDPPIYRFSAFSFHEEALFGINAFRVAQQDIHELFFTQLFIDAVMKAGLTGLRPRLRWSTDSGPLRKLEDYLASQN